MVMNLTGSVCFIFYFIVRKTIGNRLGYKWYYGCLIANILCFLIPHPLLGNMYLTVLYDIKKALGLIKSGVKVYTPMTKMVIETDDGLRLSFGLKIEILAILIYILGITVVSMIYLLKTKKQRDVFKGLVREGIYVSCPEADILKKEYGIKRKIRVFRCSDTSQIATIRLFNPIIFYCDSDNKNGDAVFGISPTFRKEAILRHELYHIKRMDVLWKGLICLANILFFFNPFIYAVRKEFEKICELSCDEKVIEGIGTDNSAKYAHLLINSVTYDKRFVSLVSFSWKKETESILQKRIEGIKMINSEKKIKRGITAALTICIFALSSLTTMAYDDWQYGGADSYEMYGSYNEGTYGMLIPSEITEKYKNLDIPVTYQKEIYDGKGKISAYDEYMNSFPISDKICFLHEYNNVTWREHNVSGENCEVVYYSAKVCSKCGKMKDKTLESAISYTPCIH
jgi:beta-lactamase regulating signal transducer with metallopeptidase domain